uniref:C1q domain-containing protein n=1 Tax=Arion vulgaris TaxID=1028688 RepID=A0A0B7AJC2_9EUPU
MKTILTLCLFASVVASLTEARSSVATLTLKVTPRVIVENVTDTIQLECRPAATLSGVSIGILIHVERIDENGTASLVASHRINSREDGNDRTSSDGHLRSEEDNRASYLSVTITDPVVEDSGTYQCRFAYFDADYVVYTLGSRVNVTVAELPPAQFSPSTECECESIWPEIENLKAALAVRKEQPVRTVQAQNETCHTSFSARLAAKHGNTLIGDRTVLFNKVTSNKGNAYDASTGTFTASCAGQYFFTVTLRSHQTLASGHVEGVIVVDGVPQARTTVYQEAPAKNYQSATNGIVLTLDQGQQVKVVIKTTSAGEFIGEDYSVFSGFFLSL